MYGTKTTRTKMSKNDTKDKSFNGTNPLSVFDFTYWPKEGESLDNQKIEQVITFLRTLAKKWTFQTEKGEETEGIHLQGRISLFKRARLSTLANNLKNGPLKDAHLSPTTTRSKDNDFYVCKIDTRIDGPWKDDDNNLNNRPLLPKQVTEFLQLPMYPYQKSIKDSVELWDTRTINLIVQPAGNIGKSISSLSFFASDQKFIRVPAITDPKDFSRMICDKFKTNKQIRVIMVDIPRSFNPQKFPALFMCLEDIKSGYAWDDRYEFTDMFFDCPNIWIFINNITKEMINCLSIDRWKIWGITNDTKELIPYNINNPRLTYTNDHSTQYNQLIESIFGPYNENTNTQSAQTQFIEKHTQYNLRLNVLDSISSIPQVTMVSPIPKTTNLVPKVPTPKSFN